MKFIKKVRENLKDPKKKSLTLLGIYAIFFIVVFVLFSSAPQSDLEPKQPLKTSKENYQEMTGYNYKVTFIENNLPSIIEGTYYLNTSLFTYNNNKYYYEENLVYLLNNNSYYISNINYNIEKIFNNNLSTILDSLQQESVTTYNDGRKKINYIISADTFNKYYFETNSNYNINISVEIIEQENYINHILIDLTNMNISLTKIEIEYNDINKISNLEFNKEDYSLERGNL